ncbi:MAG: hypothetical protein E7588_05695 [Ruminococcaceae bacterium]|nr:hypothetical protein [Oscillospiraceae bacterium]
MKRFIAFLLAVFCLASVLAFTACTKQTMGGHPVGKLEFTNNAVEYKFYYPDTWQTQMNDGMACLYVSANDPSNVSVSSFSLGDFATLDDYISGLPESFASQWNTVFGETDFGEPADIKVGGCDAKQYIYEVSIGGLDYKYMQVFVLKDGIVHTITYAARTQLFDTHLQNVNEILSSFTFKE